MNNIIKILDSEFLLTRNNGIINFCEINSKLKTKLKINYKINLHGNIDIGEITKAIIEELIERIHIRQIENN